MEEELWKVIKKTKTKEEKKKKKKQVNDYKEKEEIQKK